jgi:hypothetical protein
MFLGIHLPGLVGPDRPHEVMPRPSPRGGRAEPGADEPPLQGAFRGGRLFRRRLRQVDPDQAGPPRRVRAAETQGGGLRRVRGRGRAVLETAIIGSDRRVAASPEPREQATDRRTRQVERRGDLVRLTILLPEPEGGLANRHGDGAWHGRASSRDHHENTPPTLYSCTGAIKLGVGIRAIKPDVG